MKRILTALVLMCPALASADYTKGMTMFQIYGGGSAIGGEYDRDFVPEDDRDYADPGSIIGGQFLYFIKDSPSLAIGVDISHAGSDEHVSHLLVGNRLTESSAKATTGMFIARLSYPKGRLRPYVQGGLGAHHTSLRLDGMPISGTSWSDTSTIETRKLYNAGHTGLALGGSVGLHVYFTEQFYVGAEFRNTLLFGNDFKPTAAGRNEGLGNTDGSVALSSLGFMLGFGF